MPKKNINSNKSKSQIKEIKVDILLKIRSKYILRNIFDKLPENKLLDIIRYNKKKQKDLNKNLNDYKNYSKIEIEIIPGNEYGYKFINDCDLFTHIYFNEEEKEIQGHGRNEIKSGKVSKIRILIDKEKKSLNKLFKDCFGIKKINFIRFNRTDIKDTNKMFDNCRYMEELNISKLITNNVTNMSWMFCECDQLKKLNVSNFNTSKVISMTFMFCGCRSLKELNVSNFNTKKVNYMNHMFQGCSSLNELNLSNFKTDHVTDMKNMLLVYL